VLTEVFVGALVVAGPNVCPVPHESGVGQASSLAPAAVAAAASPPAFGQDTAATGSKKSKKKKEKKVKTVDTPAPDAEIDEAEESDPEAPPRGFVWRQHPSLRIGKMFRLDFEAKFQEDLHGSDVAPSDLERFELHRNRVGIQGKLFKHIDYEVERELTEKEVDVGKTPKSPWKDVDINVDYIKNAQIQVGKFKIPFGLDQLTGVTHGDFVYRSLGANYLAPARDVGAMVHGRFFKHRLNYSSGVFRHDGDNAHSGKIQGGDTTFAARLTGVPFRRIELDTLQVGAAMTVSALSDDSFRPNGLRGRTLLTQYTFFDPVYVKGQRRRWEGDLDWTVGPASARAEYTLVRDDRRNQGLGDQNLPDARYRSWYVSGTYVLTGEDKTRPVKPAHDFLAGGVGALELAVRYERMWFDSVGGAGTAFANPRAENILPNGDRALTLGVNWTLNRFLKLQIDGIRERVEDLQRSPASSGAAFWSRVARLQFVL